MNVAQTTRKARLDRVDAEAVREMMATRGWKLFLERMTVLKQSKHEELEQRLSEVDTAIVRGYLEAIRAVASIPDILFREGNRGKGSED
jgi:hypothetical protein